MQKLNKIITGDIFNNDHWSQLRKNLTEVMADPDEELTVCCLCLTLNVVTGVILGKCYK